MSEVTHAGIKRLRLTPAYSWTVVIVDLAGPKTRLSTPMVCSILARIRDFARLRALGRSQLGISARLGSLAGPRLGRTSAVLLA